MRLEGKQVKGVSKITLTIVADANALTPDISLEFEGIQQDESGEVEWALDSNNNTVFQEFSHKIKGQNVNISVSGEFNEYPFT